MSQALSPLNLDDPRIAIVRTSDRQLFKRCRRKWSFESGLRRGLRAKESPGYFWLGTGGHYALEDYHGYNYYQHPVEAFRAYVKGCEIAHSYGKMTLPEDYLDHAELGEGILENYIEWLSTRKAHETYWVDGVPQVELKCLIPLIIPGIPNEHYDAVYYQFQLDKVIIHEDQLYIVDYKFYQQFSNSPLEYDQQLTAYTWATTHLYPDKHVVGAILHEFKKDVPNSARILKNGSISSAQNQKTSYFLYRQALLKHYGTIENAPVEHQTTLYNLMAVELPDSNPFIRRVATYRTAEQLQAEGSKILMELEDMLNPNLPIYTNATRDCSWDCQQREVCLLMDRDDDWESLLEATTVSAKDQSDTWRDYLPR